jgi:hypothetical protein
MKSAKNGKNKSGNHVSFNINNAIYTSRQETPIPISVLKQQQQQNGANGQLQQLNKMAYNNINQNDHPKPILVNNNSEMPAPTDHLSLANSMMQACLMNGQNNNNNINNSTMKKSNGISDLLNQYVQNEKQQQQQQTQSANNLKAKIDAKTTIL